jgi:ABC-2 type transport system ATP-binding protein
MVAGKANDARMEEVLDIVDLRRQARDAYRKYSLGMKQRLGIAAALLTDPELVLLDEPTNGLDPAGVFEIRQLIQRLSSLGKTIFLSSHILYEVQQVCNRVAILQRGNLIKQGNVSELLQQDQQVLVRMSMADETQGAFAALQEAREQGASWMSKIQIDTSKQGSPTLRISAPTTRSAEINALLVRRGFFAAELRPIEGSLEEVFLELTTPTAAGVHPGMAALAGEPVRDESLPPSPDKSGSDGKRGVA